MWIAILVSFLLIITFVIVVFTIKKNKEKLLYSAIASSPRINKIKEINDRYHFVEFKNNFEYCVHFNDLDEFKTADLKLIKYSFLLKNRSAVVNSLKALNSNLELYDSYLREINEVKEENDGEYLAKYKINHSRYHEVEIGRIAGLIKKPVLKCSFDIYFDYSSSTGRSTRESEHFKVVVTKTVNIDAFLFETFPVTSLDEYNFKPHYLNKHLYVHYNLLVSEEELNLEKAQKAEEDKNKQYCVEFYEGRDIWYFPELNSCIARFFDTRKTLVNYLEEQGLKYEIREANKFEYFFIIENTVYLYVGNISSMDGKPVSITNQKISSTSTYVVELNYNPFFDFKTPTRELPPFIYYKFLSFSSYTPFEMAIGRCKALLPEIDIERINAEWEGVPASFIVYEINYGSLYGYSLAISEDIEDSVAAGRRKFKDLLTYEKDKAKKEKKMENDKGNLDDLLTYDLSCSKQFLDLLKVVKEQIRKGKIRCDGDSVEEKVLSQIVYYVVPFYLKDKTRENIKRMKEQEFNTLNHNFLLQFDSYPYINSHKKWKNEYLLYQICKKLYGRQVVYQYRPEFLKTTKGQLSYDLYLSKYRIAIEYQGEQHFKPIDYFGGQEAFDDLVRRDRLKKELSIANDVKLVEIKFDENFTSGLIENKISNILNN